MRRLRTAGSASDSTIAPFSAVTAGAAVPLGPMIACHTDMYQADLYLRTTAVTPRGGDWPRRSGP